MEKITIQNLKCSGCSKTILAKLNSLDFVNSVEVVLDTSTVQVELKDNSMLNKVKLILSNLGYPAIEDQNTIGSKAKSFVSCAIGRLTK